MEPREPPFVHKAHKVQKKSTNFESFIPQDGAISSPLWSI